jgi:S1-C subfamily serine protease
MRLFLAIATMLAVCLGAQASTLPEVFKGSLKLYSDNDGFCSATIVGERLLLSANHCTKQAKTNIRVDVRNERLEVIATHIVYLKPVRTLVAEDVALFEPVDPKAKWSDYFGAEVGSVDIATAADLKGFVQGNQVWAVGFPMAMERTITEGVFNGFVPTPDKGLWDTNLYSFTAPIIGGNSGGALIAKFGDKYKIIGVNVGAYTKVNFLNMASPLSSIEKVMKGFAQAKMQENIKKAPPPPSGRTDEK